MQLLNLTLKCYLLKLSRNEKPFWITSQNNEYPRKFRVKGANQKARKLLFTNLVNTNTNCFCYCFTRGGAEILRSVADARSTFHEYNRANSMLIRPKAWSWEKGVHGARQGLCVESMSSLRPRLKAIHNVLLNSVAGTPCPVDYIVNEFHGIYYSKVESVGSCRFQVNLPLHSCMRNKKWIHKWGTYEISPSSVFLNLM